MFFGAVYVALACYLQTSDVPPYTNSPEQGSCMVYSNPNEGLLK